MHLPPDDGRTRGGEANSWAARSGTIIIRSFKVGYKKKGVGLYRHANRYTSGKDTKYPISAAIRRKRGCLLKDSAFKPKIVAFCCQYCAYNAADLAGAMRLQYSSFVRIVRLMCTGKVDSLYLLKAFEEGADAVFVAG